MATLEELLGNREFVPRPGAGIFQRTTPGNEGQAMGAGLGMQRRQMYAEPTAPEPVPGYGPGVAVRKNIYGEDEFGLYTPGRGFAPIQANPGSLSFRMAVADRQRRDLIEDQARAAVPLNERKFAWEQQQKQVEADRVAKLNTPIPANKLPADAPEFVRNALQRSTQVKWLQDYWKEKRQTPDVQQSDFLRTQADAIPASAVADIPSATGGSGFFGGIANTIADMIGAPMPYQNVEKATQAHILPVSGTCVMPASSSPREFLNLSYCCNESVR